MLSNKLSVSYTHEAGYVYSIWSTYYHFPYGYFTSVHFIIWEVLLANEGGF